MNRFILGWTFGCLSVLAGWFLFAPPKPLQALVPEIVCARFNPPSCHVQLGAVISGAPILWLEPPQAASASPVEFQSVLASKPEHSVSWIDRKSGVTIKAYPTSKCVQHETYFQCGEEQYPPNSAVPVPAADLCVNGQRMSPDGTKWCIY